MRYETHHCRTHMQDTVTNPESIVVMLQQRSTWFAGQTRLLNLICARETCY